MLPLECSEKSFLLILDSDLLGSLHRLAHTAVGHCMTVLYCTVQYSTQPSLLLLETSSSQLSLAKPFRDVDVGKRGRMASVCCSTRLRTLVQLGSCMEHELNALFSLGILSTDKKRGTKTLTVEASVSLYYRENSK